VEQRVFTVQRAVRGTDVTTDGRLRLDALARYLQDAAEDDVTDAGLREPYVWVLRRCALDLACFPRLGQGLTVRTFCTGTGPRWAERTTTLSGGDGELVRATAVWAAVAPDSGRPSPLGPEFLRVYGPTAAGRTVSARLSHPRPPEVSGDGQRPWPLRATDFDAIGHVNNTVHWSAVEDALAGLGWLPATAEIEYQRPALPGTQPRLLVTDTPGQAWAWLLDGTEARQSLASALLTR
jgi:acyl-ACP thioesterase